jgi:putative Holliday junction resolvase
MPGRILAVDWGAARIGLAVSDPTQTLATPLATLHEKDKGAQIQRVSALVHELEATRVIVGLPLHLDGGESPSARSATKFAEKLARFVDVPVELVDERFTSVVAEERLIEAQRNIRSRASKGLIDSAAAAVLLQEWLDLRPGRGGQ